jgi:hypothetical protein
MLVVPSDVRGRAFGLAQSGMQALQGLSLATGGALALVLAPHTVIALFGVAGLLGVAALGAGWPTAELAALHAPVDETDIGPLGDIPLEQSGPPLPEVAPLSWAGPYPLVARRRTLLVRLMRSGEPAAGTSRDSPARSSTAAGSRSGRPRPRR